MDIYIPYSLPPSPSFFSPTSLPFSNTTPFISRIYSGYPSWVFLACTQVKLVSAYLPFGRWCRGHDWAPLWVIRVENAFQLNSILSLFLNPYRSIPSCHLSAISCPSVITSKSINITSGNIEHAGNFNPITIVGCKKRWWCGWEYLLGRCPAGHAALRESVKHYECRRITTLCLLNYTRVRANEHGSYIRSSVHLTSVEHRLTQAGQRWPHRGHLQLTTMYLVMTRFHWYHQVSFLNL
jgi:hypothetical protein